METRRLGKTGYMSSIITFAGAGVGWVDDQGEVDAAIELAVSHGVNHFDVAPLYGEAEVRLGSWMQRHYHGDVFLACKTLARSKTKAWESIKRSLDRLRVDHFDLFQFHMVDELETLYAILSLVGAMEAILEARQQGLLKYIGITSHRPYVQMEALSRFDFDTISVPVNRVLAAHPSDPTDFTMLLELARQKDVGVIGMKAIAKCPWETRTATKRSHKYKTWYEPFADQAGIDKGIRYVLSQNVATTTLPADISLWPKVLKAAETFKPMSEAEQARALSEVESCEPMFPTRII